MSTPAGCSYRLTPPLRSVVSASSVTFFRYAPKPALRFGSGFNLYGPETAVKGRKYGGGIPPWYYWNSCLNLICKAHSGEAATTKADPPPIVQSISKSFD